MKRKISLTALFLAVSLLLCACLPSAWLPDAGKPGSSENSENATDKEDGGDTMLTQRQIDILKQEGLSTNYEELLYSQKLAITAIEEMLCHLEETYGGTAVYVTYVAPGPLDEEMLVAMLGEHKISLTRHKENGSYVYEDDYAAVTVHGAYVAALSAYFADKGVEARVFAEINSAEDTGNVIAGVDSSNFVFVKDSLPRDEFQALAEEFSRWLAGQLENTPCVTRFYYVSESLYPDIGDVTYRDCIPEIPREDRLTCSISASGNVELS